MNETALAITIIVASFIFAYIDPNDTDLFEYVIVSLLGYIIGFHSDKFKPKGK